MSGLSADNGTVTANGNGTFTVTPAPNYSGAVALSYSVVDGNGGTVAANQSFSLAAVNDAPVAAADTYTTTTNRALAITVAEGVLANDRDVDAGDALSAAVVQPPSNGTLALNADGSFTYTPGNGFQGTDSFTYVARDAAQVESAATSVSIGVVAGGPGSPPAGGGGGTPPVPPAGGGSTVVSLTGGNDSFTGTGAAQTVYGLEGNDTINGGAGDDGLDGGAGLDRLIGGPGDDQLTGGADADTFVFGRAGSRDVITDFATAGGDVVELPANLLRGVDTFAELGPNLSDVNGSAVLDLGGGNTVTFQGVATAQLKADDFIFV